MPLIDAANTYTLKIKSSEVPYIQTRQNIQNCTLSKVPTSDPFKNSPRKKKQENKTFQNQINRLKIAVSDRQFDLKKIEEDFAQEKKILTCEIVKLKSQNKNIVREAKERLQQEIEYWGIKLEAIKSQQASSLQEEKMYLQKQFQQKLQLARKQLQQKYQNMIVQLQNKIQAQREEHNKKITDLKMQNLLEIQKIKAINEKNKTTHEKQYYETVQNIKKQHQNQINFYQESLKSKDRQIRQFQNAYKSKIGNCQEILIQRNKEIQLKNEQINFLNQTISTSNKEKQNYRLDKVCLERKLSRLDTEYQEKYQQRVNEVNQELASKTQQMKNYYLKATEQINQRFKQFTEISNHKEKLLEERSIQLLSIFKNNKSKEEDLKRIESLELKLIKKQFELEHEKEQLKTCKLELNNMDKMYQKVFQQAKMKAFKSRKLKLPSLMNRSTMDCYQKSMKDNRKLLKQNINYMTKDVKQLSKFENSKQNNE